MYNARKVSLSYSPNNLLLIDTDSKANEREYSKNRGYPQDLSVYNLIKSLFIRELNCQ